MMVTVQPRKRQSVFDRLPAVRGELRRNEPMARYAWLRVGGPAEILFRPADLDDLRHFLRNTPIDVPVMAIGVASNLLIRDGGIPGVVIQLRQGFNEIATEQDDIQAGAGALDINVARFALSQSLGGLEFLSGIPGTIGGALRMNAGAYGAEMADVVRSVEAIDRNGNIHRASVTELGFSYRHTEAPLDWIFTGAVLRAVPDDRATIAAKMDKIGKARAESQPVRSRTGGSTFKNPEGHSAWELIDQAGCRGLRVGNAQVSQQHCNFLINLGQASAYDLERLGAEVRRRVHEKFDIMLDWEIDRVGLSEKEAAA
jgi:UDP-N-acetylmuramate dehydrogenase